LIFNIQLSRICRAVAVILPWNCRNCAGILPRVYRDSTENWPRPICAITSSNLVNCDLSWFQANQRYKQLL
jgi:hypothetical protein